MSTSFNARGVSATVKEISPEYTFRHCSTNARQPLNRADAFETNLINQFKFNRQTEQLQGYVKRNGEKYFYVAKPVISQASCFQCHGRPEDAPKEVVDTYGSTAAFGWTENDVVASLVVYVPTRVAEYNALRALAVFTGFYAGIFIVALIIIDRLIVGSIIRPIQHFVTVAESISTGDLKRDFNVTSNDEMKTLADAFTRMKVSIVKAVELLERKQ